MSTRVATRPRRAVAIPAARIKGCCQPVAAPIPAEQAGELAALHRAMADETRLQMLHMLKSAPEPICVCDFTAAFDLAQPTVSHHLARLRDAGLVTSFKRGIWAFYRIADDLSPAAAAALRLVP